MELGNKYYLIFLLIPIVILIIMLIGYNKKNQILRTLKMKSASTIERIRMILFLVGSILVVIALVSPQKLLDESDEKVKGMNLYVLIDVSRSMMTEDVYPNRLEAAKRILEELLKNLKGDRIGFIPFSDSAYIQMPLTDDYSIGKNYINAIDSNLISGGGTELYEGLTIAERSFKEIENTNKTVLILSDGGDQDDKSLQYAKDNKIDVYSVGIGTNEGGIIPDHTSNSKNDFIRDKSGSAVISKLNSTFLKTISSENNGKYYEINNLHNNFDNFFKDIRDLERKDIRDEKVKLYRKYFQIPLGIGLLLLLIGFFIRGKVRDEE